MNRYLVIICVYSYKIRYIQKYNLLFKLIKFKYHQSNSLVCLYYDHDTILFMIIVDPAIFIQDGYH